MNITELVIHPNFRIGNPSPNMKVVAIGPQYVLVLNEGGKVLEKQSSSFPYRSYTNILEIYDLLGDTMLEMFNCKTVKTSKGTVFVSNEYHSYEVEIQVPKSTKAIDINNDLKSFDLDEI